MLFVFLFGDWMKVFKTNKRLDLLVTGYIKETFDRYAPDIVIHKISIFYSNKNTIPFNVYRFEKRSYKCIKINGNINNIIDMYTIGSSQYYITNDNQLYTFGKNIRGRLGIGKINVGVETTFRRHEFFDGEYIDVISQSRNSFHCFVCMNDKLYGSGNNESKSQQLSTKISTSAHVYTPQLICNIYDVFKSPIKQIESGLHHTMFLTENGNIYGSGGNSKKQLLLDDIHKIYDITLIPKLKHIQNICCGDYSSYTLDMDGIMLAFGQNKNACLGAELDGIGYNAKSGFNKISHNDTKIKGICCGSFHVSYVTDNNDVYMFGNNAHGQCGFNSPNKIIEPRKLMLNEMISDIKCGLLHNIIKTINGDYYSFGWNSQGQCLASNDKTIRQPMLLSQKYLKDKIGNNNDIIALIPTYIQTFVLQKI